MRAIVAAYLVVLGLLVTASIGVRERRVEKAFDRMAAVERVDMGVTLHVVRKAPVTGDELIPGLPRMERVGDPILLGGMVTIDRDGARLDGPSENPVTWFATELQASLILHDDLLPLWTLIEGSEGSNKTATLVRWVAVRILEYIGENVEGGITAPTHERMSHVEEEIRKWWPASWYRWSERDKMFRFHAGPRVKLVSAVQRSKEAGSPIQGANWVFHAGDEFQDHFAREADIEARGRTARHGRYKRLNTSTPKDSSDWRTFRDKCKASKPRSGDRPALWSVVKMLGRESPFISDDHWQNLIDGGTMTDREIRRRIDAEDVGPERQVYYCFARERNGKSANLCRIPPGAVDITAHVLRRWSEHGSIGLLIGHDPGKRQHVSVFLKAYRLPDQAPNDTRPRWFVVDEVTTPESTILTHVDAVQRRVRERWGCNLLDRNGRPSTESPIALVRVDPHTRSGTTHPGQDVYLTWRQQGFLTRAAFYRPGSIEPAVIKVEERINVINTLLEARTGEGANMRRVSRMFVALKDDGTPAAPMLVKAFETMERNAAGEAEAEAKDEHDMSHWPAATGYAVYLVEHGNVGMQPQREAA